jgi:DNA-binding SARP family transcriptional activator
MTTVRVELLGPLRLHVDGTPVDVRGSKRRAVLALLALAEGRTVTAGRLIDALWPTEPSGRQALQSHVSRLRGQLGAAADRLQTRTGGYRLELAAGELDLVEAQALLVAARPEMATDPAGALVRLRRAYGLWRGPMLPDLTDLVPIATAVTACAQLQREVTDALIATAIAAAEAESVLGLAAESVATDPLREPAVLLRMRALAAAGQAPEALRVGRDYRRRLADETGLDPTPALSRLERKVAGGAAGPARSRPTGLAPPDRPGGAGGGAPPAARLRATGHAGRTRRRREDPGRPGGGAQERVRAGAATGAGHRSRRHPARAGGCPGPECGAG